MGRPVLYSTNVYLKLHVQEVYRRDVHYVWCSEIFDSRAISPYSAGSFVPASSNPAQIYKQLRADVNTQDRHSSKIVAQSASLKALAVAWAAADEITADEKDEIVFKVDNATFSHWRPLLYVIPRMLVENRLERVPIAKRAGFGEEFIIRDLARNEFDLIEFD